VGQQNSRRGNLMGTWSNKRGEGQGIKWVLAHQTYAGDDCLIWPLGRDWQGYGQFGYCGKVLRAPRFMCELVNGPAPEDKPFALHTCGNGHNGCCNPNHLRWGSPSDNQQDTVTHGTSKKPGGPRQKLTDAQVTEIRALAAGGTKQYRIAAKYGVRRETIGQILRGRWRLGRRPELNRLFDPATRAKLRDEARQMIAGGSTLAEIGAAMSVSASTIWRLTNNR
jgi:hypothetical protein